MKISEIIAEVDDLRPNAYSEAQKVKWLSVLDGQIYEELLKNYAGFHRPFEGYGPDTDPDTEVLMDEAYGHDVYISYLESCIDRENAEIGKYNQSIAWYNAAYLNMANHYNRTHRPIPFRNRFRF